MEIEEIGKDSYGTGNEIELTYQVTIDDSVEPAEVLTNEVELTWTSQPGDDNTEQRTGIEDDELNDYIQTTETDLTINDAIDISKEITSTGTEYAIGDTVRL